VSRDDGEAEIILLRVSMCPGQEWSLEMCEGMRMASLCRHVEGLAVRWSHRWLQ